MLNLSRTCHSSHPSVRIILAVAFLFVSFSYWPKAKAAAPARRALTLEARVRYQRAIEEVNWRFRIWPKENPQPKPDLVDVMPLSVIRAKVEEDLRQTQALEVYWKRPVTGAQLQAEMDRISNSRWGRRPRSDRAFIDTSPAGLVQRSAGWRFLRA
ncbi:MAG: hypothetical protein HYR55_18180, partial [Acidobacteria bacterium]|nr:hypothetical protein [Acidobacteriota bacterium]